VRCISFRRQEMYSTAEIEIRDVRIEAMVNGDISSKELWTGETSAMRHIDCDDVSMPRTTEEMKEAAGHELLAYGYDVKR
jgi:hypothetical protein